MATLNRNRNTIGRLTNEKCYTDINILYQISSRSKIWISTKEYISSESLRKTNYVRNADVTVGLGDYLAWSLIYIWIIL